MTGRSVPPSLPRRSPPTAPRRTGALPWLGLIGSIGMAAVVTVFARLLFSQFAETYKAFGVEMPGVSQAYHDLFFLAWLGPVAVILCWHLGRDSWGPRVAGLLGLLFALVGAVSTIFAFYLLYFRMGSVI